MIGKISIADNVLFKSGKLDNDEWEAMKKHTTIGEIILGDHKSDIMQLAAKIAACHHEKWDGSGLKEMKASQYF